MRQRLQISVCALALLIFASCATTVSHGKGKPPQPEPASAAEPLRARLFDEVLHSNVASGCGLIVVGGGTPVPMHQRDADVGLVPAEVAKRIDGTHQVPLVWQPWWSAAPIEPGPLGALTIEIATLGTARKQGNWIELDARLRIRDPRGVFSREQDVLFQAYGNGEVFLVVSFDDVELAKLLALPAAANPAQVADSFKLRVFLQGGAVRASLASLRAGNSCEIARPMTPPRSHCERYYGMLVMGDGAATESRPLDAQLVPGFAPAHAIEWLRQQDPLEIAWPDGPASRLDVTYEPSAQACVTAGNVPLQVAPYDFAMVPGYKVVMPLEAVLRSADGRLLVRLTGFAETRIADAHPWDRRVEAQLDHTPIALLDAAERAGFVVPSGATAWLFAGLRTPIEDSEQPALSLGVCNLYPGAPPYPAVIDDAPNRFGCFCANGKGSQHAPIRLVGSKVIVDRRAEPALGFQAFMLRSAASVAND